MSEEVAAWTCQCGEVFVFQEDDDAREFGLLLDEHVQEHHQALMAVVVNPG